MLWRAGDGARIADKLIEFTRPERIEFGTERSHPPSIQAVVLEPSFSPTGDEPDAGEHAEVLRNRRPGHGEITGQLGHGLLTVPQQLQQAAPSGLRHRSHQIRHLNTLAFANALGKGGPLAPDSGEVKQDPGGEADPRVTEVR